MSGATIAMLIAYGILFGGGSAVLLRKSLKTSKACRGVEGSDGFSSSIGFILSTIGMSVGLGAVWRFPMLCAKWGGGAFVLAFIVITILIVLPAGLAESAYGRYRKTTHIEGFSQDIGSVGGKILGWICSVDQLCVFAYFPAVEAVVAIYLFKSLKGISSYADNSQQLYDSVNGNHPLMYAVVICLIIVAAIIGSRGAKGIEKICNFMLPVLFILLLILVVRIFTIPGIGEGIEYYIKPDWSVLLNGQMWAEAAGMALFAVGLGPGILYAYGRHSRHDTDIALDFVTVNVVQLFICILCGFVIIPAVKIYGFDPMMGKGIMFVALPKVFNALSGGTVWMILFLIALIFAGISSSISQLEVGLSALMDKNGFNLSRKKATAVAAIIAMLIAIPCVWSDSFFAVFDNIMGNIGYCVAALLIAIAIGWKFGAKKIREEHYNPTGVIKWGSWIDYLYKYLVVVVLAYFSITSIISLF